MKTVLSKLYFRYSPAYTKGQHSPAESELSVILDLYLLMRNFITKKLLFFMMRRYSEFLNPKLLVTYILAGDFTLLCVTSYNLEVVKITKSTIFSHLQKPDLLLYSTLRAFKPAISSKRFQPFL